MATIHELVQEALKQVFWDVFADFHAQPFEDNLPEECAIGVNGADSYAVAIQERGDQAKVVRMGISGAGGTVGEETCYFQKEADGWSGICKGIIYASTADLLGDYFGKTLGYSTRPYQTRFAPNTAVFLDCKQFERRWLLAHPSKTPPGL